MFKLAESKNLRKDDKLHASILHEQKMKKRDI